MDNKLASHWPISLTNGVATLFNLFLPLALVRILPPDEVGRYKIFFLYVMLSPSLFMVAGLGNGLYHWAGKYPKTKTEIRQSWTWFMGMVLIFSMIGFVFAQGLAPLIKVTSLDMRIFFLYCPFGLASIFMEDLMIARGDIWMGSFYGSGFQVFRAAGVLAAAYWGRRIDYVLWAFFGASFVRALTGWAVLFKSGDVRPILSWDRSAPVLRYAFPVSIAALAGLALQNVDQLILSFRLHPAEFAFYSMGCLTVPPLLVLEMSVNRVMIPRLSGAFTGRDMAQAAALYTEGVLELFRFLLPAAIGLIIYSNPIIRVLFTQRYMPAAHYLRLYALFYLFMSIPYDAVARAKGDGVWILQTSLLFAPLSVLATWLAISRWGAMGALITLLIVQVVIRSYSLVYQRRSFAMPFSEFLPLKDMLRHVGLAVVASVPSLLLKPLFVNEQSWFLATGLLFTIIYLGGSYSMTLRQRAKNRESIHILELVQFLSVGGLEKMVYSLSRGLNQHDRFKALVAAYDRIDDEKTSLVSQFEEAGIPLIRWEKRTGFSLQTVTRLVHIIVSKKRHILHVHDLGPLIYGSLAKCLSLGRVQLVVTLHTLLHVKKNARYRFYFKTFLRFADRIVAVSPDVKAGILALGVAPERIEVVPNGASFIPSPILSLDDKLAFKRKIMPDAPRALHQVRWILCMARIQPGKGQDVALAIWRALPKEARAEFGLVFVGPEMENEFAESLRRDVRDLPDADHIVFAGPSHHPEKWLQAAHLFMSGSQHEGMPLAPLEAVGSGLPALLSDIPGHAFLKSWAFYFDPSDPQQGAQKITEILAWMRREGDAACFEQQWSATAPLRQKWSERAMVTSYMDVFQSITDSADWTLETAPSR